MPPKQPFLYNLNKTTIAFCFAGIILSISLVLMVLQDSHREWKGWQRKFMQYMLEKTEAEIQLADKKIDQQKLEALRKEIESANARMKVQAAEIQRVKGEQQKLEMEYNRAKESIAEGRFCVEQAMPMLKRFL